MNVCVTRSKCFRYVHSYSDTITCKPFMAGAVWDDLRRCRPDWGRVFGARCQHEGYLAPPWEGARFADSWHYLRKTPKTGQWRLRKSKNRYLKCPQMSVWWGHANLSS